MFGKAADIALIVLKTKYAKWAICGTIGFLAEHGAQKVYERYVTTDGDDSE